MFSERIKELRKNMNRTQQQVADAIGVTRPAYTAYEIGNREPDFELLTKIAVYFNVSTDYLLGRVDGPHDDLVIAAHMDDNLTEQQIEEINKFIEFQKQEYIKDRDKKNGLKKD
ncbi:helix-turn-helix domain-containing protein [Dellaglioa algida]|uniref:helix-turn-helix domain-containing protein n=1 Tax=Dellaglioa algida TaxID=105612 RepID=UPI0024C48B3D|nr:helix-turn-helix transcriptional regulator [Dellaglioa algida]MDK1718685.1 helix-turn-helix domain-containing protein [Dellaglioa algida]